MPPSNDSLSRIILPISLGIASFGVIAVFDPFQWRRKGADAAPNGKGLLSQLQPGPLSIISTHAVQEAPPETMDMSGIPPGHGLSHSDGRGWIHKFRVSSADEEPGVAAGQGTTVNAYFTRKGHKRSGDLHEVAQFDVLLTGRARLTVLDPETGKEEVIELEPNILVEIPAYRPHVFEFLEDSSMLEWWDGPFRAFYYKPYRDAIRT